MVMEGGPRAQREVHVRFEGRSIDIAYSLLDLGEQPSDQEVRQALARYLEVPARKLEVYVVERHANGNLTVRPEAVFGR
jgi:hypothetical protein